MKLLCVNKIEPVNQVSIFDASGGEGLDPGDGAIGQFWGAARIRGNVIRPYEPSVDKRRMR